MNLIKFKGFNKTIIINKLCVCVSVQLLCVCVCGCLCEGCCQFVYSLCDSWRPSQVSSLCVYACGSVFFWPVCQSWQLGDISLSSAVQADDWKRRDEPKRQRQLLQDRKHNLPVHQRRNKLQPSPVRQGAKLAAIWTINKINLTDNMNKKKIN